MRRTQIYRFVMGAVLLCLLAACGGGGLPLGVPTSAGGGVTGASPAVPPTYTPVPTYTPLPTYTPVPTNTPPPPPTYTPLPTYTPMPTYTPVPTAGPTAEPTEKPASTKAPVATKKPAPPPPAGDCTGVPASVNGSITPLCGSPTTVFTMDIWAFDPNEQIGYWVSGPSGPIAGTKQTVNVGSTGAVFGLWFTPASFGIYTPGVYGWVFEGSATGHQSILYFKVQ